MSSDRPGNGTIQIEIEGVDIEQLEAAIGGDVSAEDHFDEMLYRHLAEELDVDFDGLVVDAGGEE